MSRLYRGIWHLHRSAHSFTIDGKSPPEELARAASLALDAKLAR